MVVDGGAAPHPQYLRALMRVTRRVSVLQMPKGHDGLDWLAPIASRVEELAVLGYGCDDLRALEHFTHLQTLTLTERPHATSPPLDQVAATVRDYSGPWFPGLDPILASPSLLTLMLEQPPRDLANRLNAPLRHLRLLSARRLAGVPALACANTVESLEIAGSNALDLTGIADYTGMTSLTLYGRTPLTSFDELAGCPALRRLFVEDCYAVDDIDALRRLRLDELRIVGRPESLDPNFLRTARDLDVRRFSAPDPPSRGASR